MATILEHSEISPPRDTVPEFSLPLTFFDMIWYNFAATQNILFFNFPCSKSRFLDKIVPQLKASLSITLGQFLPLAGNIIHPVDTTTGIKPILRYISGDSVSFTVSESSADSDLDHLTGNHPRDCDEFYAFAPDLPPPDTTSSENSIACPVLAVQVTLFPEKGLSIGLVCHHAVADASTVVAFKRAWALNNNNNNNNSPDNFVSLLLPSYDRKIVNGPLDSVYWDDIVKLSSSSSSAAVPLPSPPAKLPTNKFRATFVLKRGETEKLKGFVSANCFQQVDDIHVSSLTVICALVWVSSAKSAGDDVADDETEHFGIVANLRRGMKPPLPENYFGNCGICVMAELKHGQLVKEMKKTDGLLLAAKAVGKAVKETVKKEKGVLDGAENWLVDHRKLTGKRQIWVVGSPRFDNYSADYGWGKAKKFELLFIDETGDFTISKSREFEGDFEIGVSMTKLRLDAFAHAFQELLADVIGSSFVASRI